MQRRMSPRFDLGQDRARFVPRISDGVVSWRVPCARRGGCSASGQIAPLALHAATSNSINEKGTRVRSGVYVVGSESGGTSRIPLRMNAVSIHTTVGHREDFMRITVCAVAVIFSILLNCHNSWA